MHSMSAQPAPLPEPPQTPFVSQGRLPWRGLHSLAPGSQAELEDEMNPLAFPTPAP